MSFVDGERGVCALLEVDRMLAERVLALVFLLPEKEVAPLLSGLGLRCWTRERWQGVLVSFPGGSLQFLLRVHGLERRDDGFSCFL